MSEFDPSEFVADSLPMDCIDQTVGYTVLGRECEGCYFLEQGLDCPPLQAGESLVRLRAQVGEQQKELDTLRSIAETVNDFERQQAVLRERLKYDQRFNILNPAGFVEEVEAVLGRHQRKSDPTTNCLLVIDLDHFKQVNDSAGHHVGDRVLAGVAAVLKSTVRDHDIAGRLGGEEFGAFLEGATIDDAISFANRLRQSLQSVERQDGNPGSFMTASIGIALLNQYGDYATSFVGADSAMYLVKGSGRDGIAVFDGQQSHRVVSEDET